MQANKDEANRCIEAAKHHINNGNREKAFRLLLKARKMYPSREVSDLIDFLTNLEDSSSRENTESSRRNVRPTSPEREAPAEASYTSEQLEEVKKIKNCKTHYDVLGVSKDAKDSDLKKAYRKLALQFHPDKNQTPGATEAFKAIGNAFAVLSNPEKRKYYDQYGSDDNTMSRHRRSHESTHEFYGDTTPEDIFNMFFGGGYPHNTFVRRNNQWRRTSYHHSNHSESQVPASSVLFQLLPILVLVFLSMMSSWFVSDPVYSLQPSSKYSIMRRTHRWNVAYYVKPTFNEDFQGSLHSLENVIEEEYVQLLRNGCARERNFRENMLWRARNFGDASQLRKAQGLSTPSCHKLQEIYTY